MHRVIRGSRRPPRGLVFGVVESGDRAAELAVFGALDVALAGEIPECGLQMLARAAEQFFKVVDTDRAALRIMQSLRVEQGENPSAFVLLRREPYGSSGGIENLPPKLPRRPVLDVIGRAALRIAQ